MYIYAAYLEKITLKNHAPDFFHISRVSAQILHSQAGSHRGEVCLWKCFQIASFFIFHMCKTNLRIGAWEYGATVKAETLFSLSRLLVIPFWLPEGGATADSTPHCKKFIFYLRSQINTVVLV